MILSTESTYKKSITLQSAHCRQRLAFPALGLARCRYVTGIAFSIARCTARCSFLLSCRRFWLRCYFWDANVCNDYLCNGYLCCRVRSLFLSAAVHVARLTQCFGVRGPHHCKYMVTCGQGREVNGEVPRLGRSGVVGEAGRG